VVPRRQRHHEQIVAERQEKKRRIEHAENQQAKSAQPQKYREQVTDDRIHCCYSRV